MREADILVLRLMCLLCVLPSRPRPQQCCRLQRRGAWHLPFAGEFSLDPLSESRARMADRQIGILLKPMWNVIPWAEIGIGSA